MRMMSRWAGIVCRYPWWVTFFALALGVAGAVLAQKIKVRTNYKYLLPDNSQAVKDLDVISARVGGMGTLIVYVQGKELKAMERFADDLAAKLRDYPKDEVLFVDYKVDEQKAFFERNKYLYLEVSELTELRDEIKKEVDKGKAKANPLFVDLGSADSGGKKGEQSLKQRLEKEREKYDKYLKKFAQYRDGYLTNPDASALILMVKTPGSATGVDFAERFSAKVGAEIERLSPKRYGKSLDVKLTGELMTVPAEDKAFRDDVLLISIGCVLLVLLSVAAYYRSLKLTAILSLGLLGGLGATFGTVYLAIGYLTTATVFLAAIVAGNGINFGIYFLARYIEERQQCEDIEQTVARALRGTVVSVSTAALASGASYASLMGTQFKGFNHFGFIGGIGMVFCLLFALGLNPALTVLLERFSPLQLKSSGSFRRGRVFSGASAFLVERFAKVLFGLGVAAVVASAIAAVFYLRDPFDYNFRNLRNRFAEDFGSGDLSNKAEHIKGERASPHVVLADSFEEVPQIKAALLKFGQDNPNPELRTIKGVKTIYDYLPGSASEQRQKIALLAEIRKMLIDDVLDTLSTSDRREVLALTPADKLAVLTIDNLPQELVRPYVELDGKRGTLVYVDMLGSTWNGEALRRFANTVREIRLENGKIVRSSGKQVIFADMIEFVVTEGPWATFGAFALVLIVVALAYRKPQRVLIVAAAMVSGVVLMIGIAAAFGQKINFLNFIAIPIQFGIGVDYAANVYSRFLQEGPGSIGRVLRSTGGAVMITSLTTIIGYGAMWFSINGAINSFGTLANIGEFTTLAIAVLFLPAFLALFCRGLELSPEIRPR